MRFQTWHGLHFMDWYEIGGFFPPEDNSYIVQLESGKECLALYEMGTWRVFGGDGTSIKKWRVPTGRFTEKKEKN